MYTLKTFLLMAGLVALLGAVGWVLGGVALLIPFLLIALVINFIMFWFSDTLVVKMMGARAVSPEDEPSLHAMVERVAQRAGMPKPKVHVVNSATPNAFATGRSPKHASIAVTTGIRGLLTDRELEGVVGHELGHVRNRDTLITAIAAVVAGALGFMFNILMYRLMFAGLFGGFGGRGRSNAYAQIIFMLVVVAIAVLVATLVRFAITRTREYQADKTGAELTGDPAALASALTKLERGVQMRPAREREVNPALASLYIVNPLRGGARGEFNLSGLFTTHPPIPARVERLRQIGYRLGQVF